MTERGRPHTIQEWLDQPPERRLELIDRPVVLRPDWICEVLSDSNRHNDTIRKLRRHHQARVPHYWLLDPDTQTLNVFRHEPLGYLNVLTAERGQRVRAEPFEALELRVEMLLGRDPE